MSLYKCLSALFFVVLLAASGCSKDDATAKVETKELGVVNISPTAPTSTDVGGGRTCVMNANVIQPNMQLRIEIRKGSKTEEFSSMVVPSDKPVEVAFKSITLKFTPHLTQ
jgi:hypothetical protein